MTDGPFGGWEPAFYAVFARTANPMVLLDDDRTIVDANDAIATLLGYTRKEMIGRSMLDFIPSAEHEHHRVACHFALKPGETFHSTTIYSFSAR